MITACIGGRFDQPRYKIYCNVQDLLLKAANGDDYDVELKFVTEFYGSDFDGCQLKTQVFSTDCTANSECKGKCQISDLIEIFKKQV